MGYQVPPGIADATVPNPIFNLTPAATVDEGNNWINISWGPLALTNPVTGAHARQLRAGGRFVGHQLHPVHVPPTYGPAPSTDFFGNPRKTNNCGGRRRGRVRWRRNTPWLVSPAARWPSAMWPSVPPARRKP